MNDRMTSVSFDFFQIGPAPVSYTHLVTVVFGIGLGMTGYTIIWPLFGAANQLLAALALLAVCAWLGNAGKNNRMFYLPMVFMLAVTVPSLCMTCLLYTSRCV